MNDFDLSENVAEFVESDFVINAFNAVIQNVSSERNTTFVTITYDECLGCNNREQTVTLIVNNDTVVINHLGNNVPVRNLRPGMSVNVSFSTRMTRSIPPQSQAFVIQVLNPAARNMTTIGRIIEKNINNRFITTITNNNLSSIIRFNIPANVIILTPFGTMTDFSRLTPGMRVRITHAPFMTASIPPQTTAFRIQILR